MLAYQAILAFTPPGLFFSVFPLIELAGAPSGVGGAVVRHLPPEMLKESG